jgi:uncharacterized Zn finger protein (UPF0148 family)
MTPHCHHCGEPLHVHEGEPYCPSCLSFTTADPDLERERAAWREETGEDIVILEGGPVDPY